MKSRGKIVACLVVACYFGAGLCATQASAQVAVTSFYPSQPVVNYVPVRRGLFGRRIVYRPFVSTTAPVPVTTFYTPAPAAVAAPITTMYAPVPAAVPGPVTTMYAPAPVTTFQPPAPITTYYAPVPIVPAPVTTYYYPAN